MTSYYNNVKSELQKEISVEKQRLYLRELQEISWENRSTVWRYILKTPQNTQSFRKLICYSLNTNLPCIWDKYLTEDDIITLSLKRLLKWLVTWSPDLKTISFLPEFLLPFVKLFYHEPINCFEIVATVIGYWGRLWLEMQSVPQFDLLNVMEKILIKFSPNTIEIFKAHNINILTYAWKSIECGFSNVLEFEQWTELWDHLICNTLTMTLSASIAYICIIQDELTTEDIQDLNVFFNEERVVDMKLLLKKTYTIMDSMLNWPLYLQKNIIPLSSTNYEALKLNELELVNK